MKWLNKRVEQSDVGKECAAFDAGGPEEDMINTAASAD